MAAAVPRLGASDRALEGLETYQLLSTFTVVLATDSGGPTGQEVTATTGDLRYCVEQADAVPQRHARHHRLFRDIVRQAADDHPG